MMGLMGGNGVSGYGLAEYSMVYSGSGTSPLAGAVVENLWKGLLRYSPESAKSVYVRGAIHCSLLLPRPEEELSIAQKLVSQQWTWGFDYLTHFVSLVSRA
ncbi:unnamed protein product [Lepidochelys kempii]